MSERYSRLFTLPENLYAEGAPVLIAAGALLKDNQTGKVIAQLKLKNIGEKGIKAAKIKLSPLDSMNRPLGGAVIHDYLDLNVQRDNEFGQKAAILLPDAATRAYMAEVIEIGFTDNSIWTAESCDWIPLEKQDKLEAAIQDAELVKQFKIEYGATASYIPKSDRDLWLCYCGAVNRTGETTCHACGGNPTYDLEALKANCKQRLEEKRAQAEKKAAEAKAEAERRAAEEAAALAQKEAKAKKTKKTLAILLPSTAVVIAAVLLLTLVVLPNKKYHDALALSEAGEYELAIAEFEALNGFKDSETRIERIKSIIIENQNSDAYFVAETLLAGGNYIDAIEAFDKLGNYRDSIERKEEAEEAKRNYEYEKAIDSLNAGQFEDAIRSFTLLGSYKDSQSMLQKAENARREAEIKTTYQNAVALLNEGNLADAYTVFVSLGDYADSKEKANECCELRLEPYRQYEITYTRTQSYEGRYPTLSFRFYVDYSDFSIYAFLDEDSWKHRAVFDEDKLTLVDENQRNYEIQEAYSIAKGSHIIIDVSINGRWLERYSE